MQKKLHCYIGDQKLAKYPLLGCVIIITGYHIQSARYLNQYIDLSNRMHPFKQLNKLIDISYSSKIITIDKYLSSRGQNKYLEVNFGGGQRYLDQGLFYIGASILYKSRLLGTTDLFQTNVAKKILEPQLSLEISQLGTLVQCRSLYFRD